MGRSFEQLSAQELSMLDGWYRKGTTVPDAHALLAKMRKKRGATPPDMSTLYKARKDRQTTHTDICS